MDEDGFVRQRRNIIVVSLLLLIAHWTALTITEINILGNRAVLERPLPIAPILWTMWFYLGVRYWQAFNEHKSPRFLQAYRSRVKQILQLFVERNYRSSAPRPTDVPAGAQGDHNVGYGIGGDLHLASTFIATKEITYSYQDGAGGSIGKMVVWTLPKHIVLQARARALCDVVLNGSVVTERYFPIAIALAPLVLYLFLR